MKAFRSSLSCVALLLAGPLTFTAPVGAESPLRYNFKEGEVVRYILEEKTNAEIGGQKMDMTTNMDLKWRVDKVNKDGSVTMTQSIERVRMNGIIGESKTSFDSSVAAAPVDEEQKRLANTLNAFVGGEMILSLDAKGMIESVKFTKALQDKLDKLAPDEQVVAKAFSEETVLRMIAGAFPPLPNEAPGSDKTWQSKLSTSVQGIAKKTLVFKHTYDGSITRGGKKIDKIVSVATIAFEDVVDPDVSFKITEQEVKCTAHVDRTLGRLIDSEYSQSETLEIKTPTQTLRTNTTRKARFELVVPK